MSTLEIAPAIICGTDTPRLVGAISTPQQNILGAPTAILYDNPGFSPEREELFNT